MNVLISGINGHMGKIVYDLVKKNFRDSVYAGGIDPTLPDEKVNDINSKSYDLSINNADVIIDFSHHSLTKDVIDFAVNNKIALVLATTGQTKEELNYILDASKSIPLFFAANYSVGVALLIELAKKASSVMQNADIEIIETHHNRKIDAPSGTALSIANGIKEVRKDSKFVCGRNGECKRESSDIGINSIRMGNIVGIHEVIVSTNNESITLKHEAYDRALFAEGALVAAEFLIKQQPGHYKMTDLLEF